MSRGWCPRANDCTGVANVFLVTLRPDAADSTWNAPGQTCTAATVRELSVDEQGLSGDGPSFCARFEDEPGRLSFLTYAGNLAQRSGWHRWCGFWTKLFGLGTPPLRIIVETNASSSSIVGTRLALFCPPSRKLAESGVGIEVENGQLRLRFEDGSPPRLFEQSEADEPERATFAGDGSISRNGRWLAFSLAKMERFEIAPLELFVAKVPASSQELIAAAPELRFVPETPHDCVPCNCIRSLSG
ncbi:MAG: hypothetical protein RBU37_28505, partial [Myxococcota bacterium]|nr:hypothetical protein [Myxococcota bacterium]